MSPTDYSWLRMDRPTNLMHIRCGLWYAGDIAVGDLKSVLLERMVNRYAVFKQRAVPVGGGWSWEDAEDFDIDRHVREVAPPGAGDKDAMLAYLAALFPEQFNFDIPLWDVEVFRGVTGFVDEPCTFVIQRFHHAIMDGIRYVQLLVHLHDFAGESADALPAPVGRQASGGMITAGLQGLRRGVTDAVDVARHALWSTAHLPQTAAAHLRHGEFASDLAVLVHPSRLIDAVERLGSVDNETLNTASELARFAVSGHEPHTAWSGPPSIRKRVSLVDDMELARIKQFGKRHGGTVNDVLLAMISRALTHYLAEQGAESVDEIHWMVPVSLAPPDRDLPAELGNNFALIYLPMPLGITDEEELIAAVKERMSRLKHSQESTVAFEIQKVIARAPRPLLVGLSNLFASKTVGVLTNVPGPTEPMYLAGAEALGWFGFVPTSGDEPLGLCIFSYNGKVLVGVSTDAARIPHPERIAELIKQEYAALVD